MVEHGEVLEHQDEIDVELRPPVAVRARILILAAVLRRLALENPSADDTAELFADAFDEREWLKDQGLAGELTAPEAALLSSPPGSLSPEAIFEASWQGEALIALAWAIGALDLPPVDSTSDPRPVIDLVPRPWDATKSWMSEPAMVSESDAIRERERAELWHWRATSELLRREASPADRQDFDAAIREVATESLAVGILPTLQNGDFASRGRSVKDLSGDDLDVLIAVTGQRLRALNWLCGFGASWDDVPLDV